MEHIWMTLVCHSEVNRGDWTTGGPEDQSLSVSVTHCCRNNSNSEHSTEYYSMTKKLPNQTPHQRHQGWYLNSERSKLQVYRKDQKPEVTYNWKWNPKCKNRKHCMSPRNKRMGNKSTSESIGVPRPAHTRGHCPHWNATVCERHNTKRVDWQSNISPDM